MVVGQRIVLHEALGDTISIQEKQQFLLFPQVADTAFRYAVIDSVSDKAVVTFGLTRGIMEKESFDWPAFLAMRTQVSKLVAFYQGQLPEGQEKSILTSKDSTVSLEGKWINQDNINQMNKTVRQESRLQRDAERQQMYKQGLETSPTSIEIFSGGKRKKKKN